MQRLLLLLVPALTLGCGQAAVNHRLQAIETSFDAELRVDDFCPAPATVNVPYATRLTAHGGAQPYEWRVVYGSLPAGLALDARTGVISGVPRVAGISRFVVHLRAARHDSDAVLTYRVHSMTLSVSEPSATPLGEDGA